MNTFTEQSFSIPQLTGLSEDSIKEHLKLYAGYVKHANHIGNTIKEMLQDSEKNAYAIGELQRRFGFEFDGMRNHEYYFKSLEGGYHEPDKASALYTHITNQWGSFDVWLNMFKAIALTRGIGWAMLYYDKQTGQLVHTWVEEQHLGHLTGLSPVLALDMWEHSYVADYKPSGKKNYVEDFFKNINWQVIEKNYTNAQ